MNHVLPRNVASIYNPDLLTKDQLIDSFVVRLKKYEKLMADIRSAKMETPEQHIMVVGLRGMGKTTLLRRLAYEVENDPKLKLWLIPVIFNEEEYGITQLFKLWETIAEYLAQHDQAFEGLYERMDEAYRNLKGEQQRYEATAFELLLEALHGQRKKIILFIDNFGDMFGRFKKHEKQRLREILMTCPDLRIIAASSVVIEAFFRHDDPLFEFFKTERLDGLNKEETIALLRKLGEGLPGNPIDYILTHKPERVEALRRLTGGIPRSIVLFFEIFVSDRDGNAFSDLESILDRVTPLYKHRMDDLPPQQQEIMQALALNYDGITAREIADRTRLSSKLVSAQLKQMQKENLVSVANPGAKNQMYHVYDRFFNIWFLMRMARKGDKSRVLWLVRFMEGWCTPEDLIKRGEFLLKQKANRPSLKAAAEKAYKTNPTNFTAHTLACIQLWNGEYGPAHATAEHFLYDDAFLEESVGDQDFLQYFLLLLAKGQHDFLYDYFTSERGLAVRAKERFLMVWYALVSEMKEQYPLEYLRIPAELQPTVAELLEKVEQWREHDGKG